MISRRPKRHLARYTRAAENPDYTVEMAIADYLSSNPAIALDVGRAYLDIVDPDGAPMTWDEFDRSLDRLSPQEAFDAGVRSDSFDRRDRYIIATDGGFGTLSEEAMVKKCVALGRDRDFATAVICGEVRIPKDMADVVSIFVDRRGLSISHDVIGRLASAGRKLGRAGRRRRRRGNGMPLLRLEEEAGQVADQVLQAVERLGGSRLADEMP